MKYELGSIILEDSGIVWMKFDENVEFEIEHLDKLFYLWEKVSLGKKRPFIIDLRTSFATIPRKFLEQMSLDSRSGKWRNSEAILIDSLPLRIMANHYKKIESNKIPAKLFTKEEEAIEWALGYI